MVKKYVIVGNPNTGKTTLFNTITGANKKTANYSGVTVKKEEIEIKKNNKDFKVVDLPGLYSLESLSDDERVAKEYLEKNKEDEIVYVCSSADIKKNLILLTDLKQSGHKIKILINKVGSPVSDECLKNLEEFIGVPILQTDVRKDKNKIINWISDAVAKTIKSDVNVKKLLALFPKNKKSAQRLDGLLLHPIIGKIFFFIVLFLVVYVAYGNIGSKLSTDFGEWFISVLNGAKPVFDRLGVVWFANFYDNVIIGAIGGVVVYLPQLALMLMLLFFLEDIGYLPRAASVFGANLEKLGMNGKSVFSIMMGVGCTTSAMLTTRNVGVKIARKNTARFLPFVGCSAKLPIVLFISHIFLSRMGLAYVALLYLTIVVVGIIYVRISGEKLPENTAFIAEIPKIKLPSIKRIVQETLNIVWEILKKIITTVAITSAIIWLLLNINLSFQFSGEGVSILEFIAQFISVLFIPLDLGRVDVVISLISGMVAKENVVSILTMFDAVNSLSAVQAMTFLIFVMLYSPCFPALKCAKCEFGQNFAIKMFVEQLLVAYFCSFVFATFAKISMLLGFVFIVLAMALICLIKQVVLKKNQTLQKYRIN